jgi:hypothetical protein
MLREFDIKETPDGKQSVFGIKFIKANGELVFMARAVACGLKQNMSKNRLRGVVPINTQGDSIGHPTPVSIDAIVEWNNMKVIL